MIMKSKIGENSPGRLSVCFNASKEGENLINATVKFILRLTQSLRTIHRHSPITVNFNEIVSLTIKFTQTNCENQEQHEVVLLLKG
jgi:hypothetical protein